MFSAPGPDRLSLIGRQTRPPSGNALALAILQQAGCKMFGQRERAVAGAIDGIAIAQGDVALPRRAPAPDSLPPRSLRRRQWGLPVLAALTPPCCLRRSGREAIAVQARAEIGPQASLSLGADKDSSVVVMNRCLVLSVLAAVAARPVHPTCRITHVQVEGAHRA